MDLSNRTKQMETDLIELTGKESKMLSGGWLWPVVGFVIAAWDAIDGFVEGMKEGYEE